MRDPHDALVNEPAERAEEQRDAEIRRKQQIEDIKWLMAHASGRRFISRLLEEAGVHRTSFTQSGSLMAFNEGKRHIGLFVLGELLEITPEAYLKLLKEYRIE